jgi:hypothetical protein
MQTLTASESLLTLPADWIVEPVIGKRPYRKKWTETNLDRLATLAELESGKATGLGLKLGNGLLAIDIDGESAAKLLAKLAGENSLIDFAKTTAWTSGRPGRIQYLLSVEEKNGPRCRNLRIGTGITGDDGKEECLEFRWLGTQSVLPPSIHPLTKKPYTWINNPLQTPPALAPEWLIELCENWHSEYAGINAIDLVRFPSRLFPYFGRQMSVWLLARRFDISRWKHQDPSKGCGIGKFSLQAAATITKLKPDTIRGYLRDAKKSGLIHNYKQKGNWVTVYYLSFEKAITLANLKKLGPIAAIKIDDLANIHIIATEVEAQHLQRQSFYHQRLKEVEQIKSRGDDPGETPTQLIAPTTLLHPSVKPAQVLARTERFICVDSDFRCYGGSQETITSSRGISTATVSRHLSNSYRLAASPVRKFREELPPIIKKQVVERLPLPQNMPPKICVEEGLFSMFGEWWKPHCNVYLLDHRLVSARRRRGRIEAAIDKRDDKQNLCLKSSATPICIDKLPLSILETEERIEEIKPSLPEFKKWGKTYRADKVINWNEGGAHLANLKQKKPGQGKAKTIMPQQ